MRPIIALLLALLCAPPVWGGESELYLKSGYFSWTETVENSAFIREKGIMTAVGVSYSGNLGWLLDGKGLIEIWGGNVNYDGYRVEDWSSFKTNTVYIGTREELYAMLKLPVMAGLTAGPLVGGGHKYWNRSRSSEDWNTFYGRIGGRAEYDTQVGRIFAEGGLSIPFYTTIQTDWSDYGYKNFEAKPKGRLATFAESGIKIGKHLSISAYFEEMNFGQSDKVALKRVNAPSGVVQLNSNAFQPDSDSWTAGLRVGYRF